MGMQGEETLETEETGHIHRAQEKQLKHYRGNLKGEVQEWLTIWRKHRREIKNPGRAQCDQK